MKYVMFDVEHASGLVQKIPVIFPATLVHSMIAEVIEPMLRASFKEASSIRASSAGDVRFPMTDVVCGGKSETMDLGSNPVDSGIIAWNDYGFGLIFEG